MAQAGVTNVEAGIADGESLHAFDDGSVDVVTCTWGLMLMPNWKQALKVWGGRAVFIGPGGGF